MKRLNRYIFALAAFLFAACGSADAPTAADAVVPGGNVTQTTPVTEENYGQAESEIIFADYIGKIAAVTGTNGMGTWMHLRKGADPKDRAVMRINFDTLYSTVVLDLTEPATLTMPDTGGRYQSAWVITDEHYNPMAFVEPGTYTLTQENVGRRYATVAIRTMVNVMDPDDLAEVHALQDQLKIEQADKGSFEPSGNWDMEEVLAMRAKFQQSCKEAGVTSEDMFGKKGEVTLFGHNCGTAMGWGGLTPERAVYPSIYGESTEPQTLTLKDVPTNAFWSVTVYDAGGYPLGDIYNINSAFATPNEDGSYTIHFGGDKDGVNYMDIFEGWNIALRIYEPTEAYFNGEWTMPELQPAG